jgi:iron complex outermembrane receptor protein
MKRALCASCAAIGLGAVIGAAPGISLAQDAAVADSPTVGEVIVSARRVSENLEKVPVADTVVSSTELKRQDIQDYNDLAAMIPSLTSFSTYRDNFSLAIRG